MWSFLRLLTGVAEEGQKKAGTDDTAHVCPLLDMHI